MDIQILRQIYRQADILLLKNNLVGGCGVFLGQDKVKKTYTVQNHQKKADVRKKSQKKDENQMKTRYRNTNPKEKM